MAEATHFGICTRPPRKNSWWEAIRLMPGRAGVITGASGRHAATIGYEFPDCDRLNKYRESYGGALKLEARLHLLLHIHCESVE